MADPDVTMEDVEDVPFTLVVRRPFKHKLHPPHDPPLDAGRKAHNSTIHTIKIMMETVPPKYAAALPDNLKLWYWCNSDSLHQPRVHINFDKLDLDLDLRQAVDVCGVALPILISSFFDWRETGQAYMWKQWFNRASLKNFHIRAEFGQLGKSLSDKLCSHYIMRQKKEANGRLPYYCLWCDVTMPVAPSYYMFMQQKPPVFENSKIENDADLCAILAADYQIPTDNVADWQFS